VWVLELNNYYSINLPIYLPFAARCSSVQGDKSCGWDVDCPQRYSIKELQVPAKVSEAERKEQHQKAQFECANSAVGHTTPTGGWCYHTVNQTLISKDKQAVDKDYFLPLDHCAFDEGLAKAISKLFLKDGESVTDLGAGVGQAGHALRALPPRLITVAMMELGTMKNTQGDL
jgi:hypothetical protein